MQHSVKWLVWNADILVVPIAAWNDVGAILSYEPPEIMCLLATAYDTVGGTWLSFFNNTMDEKGKESQNHNSGIMNQKWDSYPLQRFNAVMRFLFAVPTIATYGQVSQYYSQWTDPCSHIFYYCYNLLLCFWQGDIWAQFITGKVVSFIRCKFHRWESKQKKW